MPAYSKIYTKPYAKSYGTPYIGIFSSIRLPSCAEEVAIAWYKNLSNITNDEVVDEIGYDTRNIYYGQYLVSGTINFYRTSGTFDYTDPSTGNQVTGVAMGTSVAVPANGICDIITSDGSYYPVCERVGTVLHDVYINAIHIDITTPVWGETLYGTDYLNQYGYVDKADRLGVGGDWESTVDGSPVILDDNQLVPIASWNYQDLLDSNGEILVTFNGVTLQVKNNF